MVIRCRRSDSDWLGLDSLPEYRRRARRNVGSPHPDRQVTRPARIVRSKPGRASSDPAARIGDLSHLGSGANRQKARGPRADAFPNPGGVEGIRCQLRADARGTKLRSRLHQPGEIRWISSAFDLLRCNLKLPVDVDQLASLMHMRHTNF